jgi:hypothetical protein
MQRVSRFTNARNFSRRLCLVFKEPIANLYGNANFNGQTGTHYAGPTWESNSGSKIVGVRLQGTTVDTDAIPWLLLGAVSSQGPGPFAGHYLYSAREYSWRQSSCYRRQCIHRWTKKLSIYYTAEYFFYKPE